MKSCSTKSSSLVFMPVFPFAAAALGAVQGHGAPLDIAGVGDGHHHILFDDGVFQGDFGGLVGDLGAALCRRIYP